MSNLWQCLQLLRIMERLREWALDTFKPWVDKYLDRIGGSEGTDRLGSLKPSPTAATFIKDRKTTEYSPEDPQLSPLKNKSVKPRNVASHMKGPMYFNILNALKRTFGKGKQNGKPTVAGSPTGEEVEREDKKKEDKRGEEKEEGEVVEDDEGESEDESEDESEEEGRENQLIKSGDFAEDEQWDHHHSPGILQAAGKEENRIQDNHQDNGAKYSEGNLPLDRYVSHKILFSLAEPVLKFEVPLPENLHCQEKIPDLVTVLSQKTEAVSTSPTSTLGMITTTSYYPPTLKTKIMSVVLKSAWRVVTTTRTHFSTLKTKAIPAMVETTWVMMNGTSPHLSMIPGSIWRRMSLKSSHFRMICWVNGNAA